MAVAKKICRECFHAYDLKEEGRYCPECGRDFWDGAATGIKKLNKEELKMNNKRHRDIRMRKNALLSILMLLFSTLTYGQIYPDEIEESDSTYSFLSTGVGTVYDHVELEMRNDSICIEGGGCLFLIPGLGVELYDFEYDPDSKAFIFQNRTDGATTYGLIPFYDPPIEVLANSLGFEFRYNVKEIYDDGGDSIVSVNVITQDEIEISTINDTTQRLRIGQIEPPSIFPTWHDSVDIVTSGAAFDSTHIYQALTDSMALDLDRDPANEGLLSFTDVGSGVYRIESNTSGGATPFFNDSSMPHSWTWNIVGNAIGINAPIDYTDIDNTPTIPTQYWSESSGDVYRSSGDVAIGSTTTSNLLGRQGLSVINSNPGIGLGTNSSTYWLNYLNSSNWSLYNPSAGVVAQFTYSGDFKVNNLAGSGSNKAAVLSADGTFSRSLYEPVAASGTGNAGYLPRWFDDTTIDKTGLYSATSGATQLGLGTTSPATYLLTGSAQGFAIRGSNPRLSLSSSTTAKNYLFYHSGNDMRLWESGDIIEFQDDRDVRIVLNLDVDGKVTVGDNVEGNAVNIAGYDSENDMTRVSIGSNLTLSSGTLSADDQTPVQSLGSATMNTASISNTYSGTTYYNISIATERLDNGNVSVNTGTYEMEISETAYYNVILEGAVDTSGSDDEIDIYIKKSGTSTYTHIGKLHPQDAFEKEFSISRSVLMSSGDDYILSAKHSTTGQGTITMIDLVWDIQKI